MTRRQLPVAGLIGKQWIETGEEEEEERGGRIFDRV